MAKHWFLINKYFMFAMVLFAFTNCTNSQEKNNTMKFNQLTAAEEHVILDKGTEYPWTGEFVKHKAEGTYTCKRCDAPLYKSDAKFDSNCGWPSFDDEIEGAIKRVTDADGRRTEILCANCGGHLGHVFLGEGFTAKNTRHCVNSISLKFEPLNLQTKTEKAYFAAGCFWGVEFYLKRAKGVLETTVGYTGGKTQNPTYQDVCYDNTGHAEVVEVVFNPEIISFETLAKQFFELHDPTQLNRQGPDVGDQYRSAVYYTSEEQKQTTEKLIEILKAKGYKVVTQVEKFSKFYSGEDYHQDYYQKKGGVPYCHKPQSKF